MTVPPEAITAATQAIIAVAYDFGHGNYVGGDAGKFARAAVQAAAPHVTAAECQKRGAEQAAVLNDLAMLLRVLGPGDHARPESPHEVMLDAINEVGRLRTRLEFAERTENWIRGDERQKLAAELLPAESIALTVARAQIGRGENPPINTTAMLVAALDRLANGR